ncbi:hypothetical protein DP73_04810 [Desulfosporosinus sp. HMP52]|uniref:YncE family protein n=1 Tax=Desulfosporosinus sp. HMP52 TaxID=1487923 RepID=UPI00051FD771|nr:hypothetical protein [Desulfosporosinus sp. HMP52]KGK91163.1 hypothetical protein DP73_04810 [Desulfosporosinus sp. HMP52]
MIILVKKYPWLWALAISLLILLATGCSKDNITGTISYGKVSPDSREFLLDYYDLGKSNIIEQVNLGPIFGRSIFIDNTTDTIWVPAAYTSDLSEISNMVKIINKKVTEIKVGLSPVDIQFNQNIAAITCLERGFNDVTTYFVNTHDFRMLGKLQIGGDNFQFSDLDKDNGILYSITQDVDHKVSILSTIDIASQKLINQFKYENTPLSGIKFVNNELWICGGNKLINVDQKTGEKIETIEIDSIARQIVSDGQRLIISHYYPDSQEQKGLTVLNLNNRTVKRIDIKDVLPSSIILDGHNIYIVDEMAGTLSVYDMRTSKIISTYSLGQYPTNIVLSHLEGL